MVDWQLSNRAVLLESLRKYLGGTIRPDNLYWYTGILPVVDVGNILGGNQRVVNGTITVSSTSWQTQVFAIPSGKRWKVLALGGWLSSIGGGVTVSGIGANLQDSTGTGQFVPLGSGTLSSINIPIVAQIYNSFYVSALNQIGGGFSTGILVSAYTSGSPAFQITVVVNEEDDPQQN